MSENESGPCKGCIVYIMCDETKNYIDYTKNKGGDVDSWTWVMIGRDLNRKSRRGYYGEYIGS